MRIFSDKGDKSNSANVIYFALLAAIIIAVAFSYGNVIQGELQFDDEASINNSLADTSFHSLFAPAGLKGYLQGNRAITLYSFALNYHFSGLDVASYHITNIIIHACTVVLAFFFVYKLLVLASAENRPNREAKFFAFCVAAIFALHPLQTEAVSYIVQRSELLASLCYLGYLVSLLNFTVAKGSATPAWWSAGLLFFMAGWGCKEIIITAPLTYLLCMLYIGGKAHLSRTWKGLVPYLAGACALTCYKLISLRGNLDAGFESFGPGWLVYFLTQLKVVAGYLGLFFYPSGQNIDHDVAAITSLLSMEAALFIIFWLCVIIASLYLLVRFHGMYETRLRLIGFGILWYLVILMPTSSIIPLRDVMFEHRVYLPLMGLAVAFIAFMDLLVSAIHPISMRTTIMTFVCLSLAAFFIVATQRRNMVWQTKLALWQDAALKSPNKSRPRNNLGNCYLLLGNDTAAAVSYRTAIQLDSGNIEAYYNLALALKNLGRIDEALQVHRMFVNLVSKKTAGTK